MAFFKKSPLSDYEQWLEDQQRLYDMTPEKKAALKKDDRLHGKVLSPYFPEALKNQQAVKQKAMEAMFEATQEGATQSFVTKGEPFSMSRYKSTAMFPEKVAARSDPGRLQAAPVGYEEEEWWRRTPSIFDMKPYSW